MHLSNVLENIPKSPHFFTLWYTFFYRKSKEKAMLRNNIPRVSIYAIYE